MMVTTVSRSIKAFLIPHVKLLLEMGHKVDVATQVEGDIGLPDGVRVFDIPFSRSPLDPSNMKAFFLLRRILKEGGYHLLHLHNPVASFVGRVASWGIEGLKVLYTAHGFYFYRGAPLLNWLIYYPLEFLAARLTDALITINAEDHERALSLPLRGGGRVFLVDGVGVDISRFRPPSPEERSRAREELGLLEDHFVMLCVGELNRNKNQTLLVKAMGRLRAKVPRAVLLLAGDGPARESLLKEVEGSGLRERVRLLGHVAEVQRLLWASDLALSASLREGLPVNVMEAMACALPVVASDCRGNRDLVRDGENGFLYRTNDLDGLVSAVERFYRDPNLRREMGLRGREMVRRFELGAILARMREIYEEILSQAPEDQGHALKPRQQQQGAVAPKGDPQGEADQQEQGRGEKVKKGGSQGEQQYGKGRQGGQADLKELDQQGAKGEGEPPPHLGRDEKEAQKAREGGGEG